MTFPNIKAGVLLSIAFVVITSINVCSQEKSVLKLADEYSRALAKYQKQKTRRSVESVMRKGKVLDDKLREMEELSETDYALFKKKMKGFVVNREETLYVKPNLKFFWSLAEKHGTKADMAFFSVVRDIRPYDVWAAYIEPQTDYSGCTIYGNGMLTRLYGKALKFQKAYPRSYVGDIKEEIDLILEEFSDNSCACGDRQSVEKEFRLFIKTYPRDKNTPAIKKNFTNIQKGNGFRFYCQSG